MSSFRHDTAWMEGTDPMQFIVSRSSQYGDARPCDEARQARVVGHTYWTFKSVAEASKKYPDKTFEKTPGGVRTVGKRESAWVVDIDTIDDLMKFTSKHGSVVIQPWSHNHELTEIEIYDDYRE